MRRWMIVLFLPLVLLLTFCISEKGVVGGDEEGKEEGKGEGEGEEEGLALPWKPKDIADTLEDLADPDWDVRVKAVRKVVTAGPWIVPFLDSATKRPRTKSNQFRWEVQLTKKTGAFHSQHIHVDTV